MVTDNFVVGLLGMFLIVFGAVMLWRQWQARRHERALSVAAEEKRLAREAEEADHVLFLNLLEGVVAEHAAFEEAFNRKHKVRYDKHLRRRAVLFRLSQKTDRPLTERETRAVKERVS